jgi:hypothetical protein
VDGERESWRKWARVLTPADLQPTVVKGQALDRSNLVKSHSSSWVDEGNELQPSSESARVAKDKGKTYRNVLILHVPDALQHASPDGITQVLSGGLGVNVPEIDRPVQRLVSVQTAKAVHAIHAPEVRSERQVGGHGRPEAALGGDGREGSLSNKGLGRGSLSSLCSGLLRLGDVGASILAIVDTLPCPGGLCRESVDDLCLQEREHHKLDEGREGPNQPLSRRRY